MNQGFNIWRGLIRLMLALGLLAAGAQACALTCTIMSDINDVQFGAVTVPRDAPIGADIGPMKGSTVRVNCPANTAAAPYSYYLQIVPALAMSGVPGVWATGMAGIGIRVVNATSGYPLSNGSTKTNFAPSVQTNTGTYYAEFSITYQLVKTAAQVTTGGPLIVPQMFYLISHDIGRNQDSGPQAQMNVGAGGRTTIATATCSVTTNPINVTLPALPASDLKPAGATGGDTSFQIQLQCGAGTDVYVTLTDATTPGNRTDQLTLASGSSASGVKLRILNASNTPVSFGPDSATPGNQNQWLVGNSDNISGIPLTVQYISTGAVTAGTVKAAATFTLSYQ